MRDQDRDDSIEDGAETPGMVSVALRWSSAAVSLALVGALVIWGVQLGLRDAQDVPVIRAMVGPARVAPEAAGGEAAAHQGLEVNEILAGNPAGTPSDAALAPPPPILGAETAPAPLDTAPEDVNSRAAALAPSPAPTPALTPAAADGSFDGRSIDALVEEALSTPTLRPRLRPRTLRAPPASRAGPPLLPAMPEGTLAIQFGAYASLGAAHGVWSRLTVLHDELLADRAAYVEEAQSGDATVYRLRAIGFRAAAEQDGLCEALRARGVGCIPVAVR